MATFQVQVNQVGSTTSEGIARKHHVLIDRPEAKGGEDKGAMGGELLMLSLGGCFMSTLLAAIRAREANIRNVQITIDGSLSENPSRFVAAQMKVAADYDDRELMEKIVTIAERSCIVTNTLKGALELSITVAD
ncbi:MAG: OsmC family protein [Acidobacteria bacterium]|nr:OsmC family protein [Acidobacteriota bacterium]MCI0718177.1 OsmC family protein [Acidobacteriota bacterium]